MLSLLPDHIDKKITLLEQSLSLEQVSQKPNQLVAMTSRGNHFQEDHVMVKKQERHMQLSC